MGKKLINRNNNSKGGNKNIFSSKDKKRNTRGRTRKLRVLEGIYGRINRDVINQTKKKSRIWKQVTTADTTGEVWTKEKQKVGKKGYRERKKCTSDTILYADVLGARESAATMVELEKKTGTEIVKLYKIMRKSRLAVNNDKHTNKMPCMQQKKSSNGNKR